MQPSDVERQIKYAKSQLATAYSALRKVHIASGDDLEKEQLAEALRGISRAHDKVDEFAHDFVLRAMPHRAHAGEWE